MNSTIKPDKLIHIGFDIGLLFKAINSLAEIAGGIVFIFFPPKRLDAFISFVTKGWLSRNPDNPIMKALVRLGHSFGISTWHFVVFYLLSHGILKFTVIFLLWKKKLWAYPLTVVVLIGFIAYQLFRFASKSSIFMLLFTVFDMIMIALTILEYKRIKRETKA